MTEVSTRTWSEHHLDLQGSRRKENTCHLCNFIHFVDLHNCFEYPVTELIYIATGVIESDYVNKDTAFEIGTRSISSKTIKNWARGH